MPSEMNEDITVLVVDDQRVVRDGLASLVDMLDGLRVVGTAADGAEAIELASELRPDIVLMDLRMPGVDGVEATRAISNDVAVIVMTTYTDDQSITSALAAGARGYLTKDATADVIANGIRAVRGGALLLDGALSPQILGSLQSSRSLGGDPDSALRLTEREVAVLRLMAIGRSNQEIAGELHVGIATVKTHVNSLFAKLGVRDRAQAIAFAYQHGIVEVSPPQG